MTPANTPGSRVWWHTNWSGLVVRRRWRGASLRQPRRTRERDHRAASAAGRVLVAPRVPAGCPNLALYNDFQLYNLPEGGARPEQVRATISSWDLFATLGVQPSIGRCFTPEDDQPSGNATVIVVIAVGKGATISLFTVVWSVLLKPLPFGHPEQLVRLYESSERFPANVVAPGIYGEWKRESRSISERVSHLN